MRMAVIIAATMFSTGAVAQLVGGQVGGAVGGATGTLGSAQGSIGVDPTLPNAGAAIDRAGASAATTVDGAGRNAMRAPHHGRAVRVDAGASLRVSRGTRCYYDDYYYDPVYRDGTYYCERSGTAVGVGASVGK